MKTLRKSADFIDTPAVGRMLTPTQAMRLAVQEGYNGVGFVSPNPLVGCVILDHEYRFLASGYHRKVGFAHAEIDALSKITDRAVLKGAHFFVTLEPCAHTGRTGSCARAIAPLGAASVTYAVEDSNPLVAGQGAAIVRDAGTAAMLVTENDKIPHDVAIELAAQAEELAEIFLHNMRKKTPFVSVKLASTLDGMMATTSGESKWITGAESRERTHLLRARYDAVAVGRGTFVADDPALNIRHPQFPDFENKAVLFDPRGRTLSALAGSQLLAVRPAENVLVLVGEGLRVENPARVRLIETPLNKHGFFEVADILERLKAAGIHSLMIEGGSQTYAAFFAAGAVQRLHAFIAPSLLGGRHGVSWSAGFGGEKMAGQIRLSRSHREILGDDIYWTGKPEYP